MADAVLASARQLNFTLSIGVAEWNNARADAADLLAAANNALAQAKAAGGNRVA
jgi:PleD family two-component response regulator